jgi:hypothetical protein
MITEILSAIGIIVLCAGFIFFLSDVQCSLKDFKRHCDDVNEMEAARKIIEEERKANSIFNKGE